MAAAVRPADDRRLQRVPTPIEKLRVAGAVARETLKSAAAKRSGVAVADLRTGGRPCDPAGMDQIPSVALSAEAAKIPPVTDVKLCDPSQWRLIGKPMERLDIRAKVTGEMMLGIDRKMDGMVYAAVLLNPNKGQPIKSDDASKAQSMPGVRDTPTSYRRELLSDRDQQLARHAGGGARRARLGAIEVPGRTSGAPAYRAILLHLGVPCQRVANDGDIDAGLQRRHAGRGEVSGA